jgi:hypothetical protein
VLSDLFTVPSDYFAPELLTHAGHPDGLPHLTPTRNDTRIGAMEAERVG